MRQADWCPREAYELTVVARAVSDFAVPREVCHVGPTALGGSDAQPGGGRAFRLVRDVAGWKAAVRLQHTWYRVRYGR